MEFPRVNIFTKLQIILRLLFLKLFNYYYYILHEYIKVNIHCKKFREPSTIAYIKIAISIFIKISNVYPVICSKHIKHIWLFKIRNVLTNNKFRIKDEYDFLVLNTCNYTLFKLALAIN